MKAVDEAAPEPTDVLVHRAGGAVARTAFDMLGGVYGRRVVVVAGKGNNGADGLRAGERNTHKWKSACWVVAGSPGMTGAAEMCSRSALRAGAGLVRLGVPGLEAPPVPVEVVGRPLPREGWDDRVLDELDRFKAIVVGPGLGRTDEQGAAVRGLVSRAPTAAVVA